MIRWAYRIYVVFFLAFGAFMVYVYAKVATGAVSWKTASLLWLVGLPLIALLGLLHEFADDQDDYDWEPPEEEPPHND